ncbi:MAG: hypothetical protein ABJB12_16805 [Pseudomonadota bacterium]
MPGCADARGRFEDFQNRTQATASENDAGNDASGDGPCAPPAPGAVRGPALLAVDTSLAEGLPILFLGTIDTPAVDGTTAVRFVYRALDAMDRSTRVGPELSVGPFPLDQGLLTAPIPESTLDGDADPILYGTPIDSEMTLSGRICGVRTFYCGTLMGSTRGVVTAGFKGKFAITLLGGPDAVPARPRFGCAVDDLAAAL